MTQCDCSAKIRIAELRQAQGRAEEKQLTLEEAGPSEQHQECVYLHMNLSHELLLICLDLVAKAIDLATAALVCTWWRQLVPHAALRHLAKRAPRQTRQEDFNLVLQLRSLERLEQMIGPRPAHSWHDEWTDMMVAQLRECARLERSAFLGEHTWLEEESEAAYREAFSTRESLHKMFEDNGPAIALAVRCNLPLEQAQVLHVLGNSCDAMLFAPLASLAASSYAVYDALSTMARLDSTAKIAPLVYKSLKGEYGLTELDESWRVMLNDDCRVGCRFVTGRWQTFTAACEDSFPDGRTDGMYEGHFETGESEFVGDVVVCIQNTENDCCGRHNLIREVGEVAYEVATRKGSPCFALPPYAVVTVRSVRDSWRVRRQTMKCRLFMCTVTFDLR